MSDEIRTLTWGGLNIAGSPQNQTIISTPGDLSINAVTGDVLVYTGNTSSHTFTLPVGGQYSISSAWQPYNPDISKDEYDEKLKEFALETRHIIEVLEKHDKKFPFHSGGYRSNEYYLGVAEEVDVIIKQGQFTKKLEGIINE